MAAVLLCLASDGAGAAGNSIVVLDASDVVGGPAVAIGGDGLPLVVYTTATQGLRVVHCGDAFCADGNAGGVLDAAASNARAIEMVASPTQLPAIRYRVGGSLKLARCNDDSCSSATVTPVATASSFEEGSIALGSDELPIVTFGGAGGALNVLHCGNSACSSGNTTTAVPGYGDQSEIAIRTGGLPLIAHQSNDDVHDILRCGGLGCVTGNTEGSVLSGQGPYGYRSLAVGENGYPMVAAYVSDGSFSWLNFARCGDDDCVTNEPFVTLFLDAFPDGADVHQAPIAVGSDGVPLVTFWDPRADNLKLAFCGNAACDDGGHRWLTIDATPGVGERSALAIGSDGLAVVAYFDRPNGDLKLLHCGSLRCNEVLLSSFEAGDFSDWSAVVGAVP